MLDDYESELETDGFNLYINELKHRLDIMNVVYDIHNYSKKILAELYNNALLNKNKQS